MKRHVARISFVLMTLLGAPALSAQTVPTQNLPAPKALSSFAERDVSQVRLLLRSYDALPPKSSFDQVAHAREILYTLANGDTTWTRDRALCALAYYPSFAVYQLYAQVISSSSTRFGTRNGWSSTR